MARYFMGDTRLAGLERMMMDPNRTPSSRTSTQKKGPQKKPPRSQSAKPHSREWEIKEGGYVMHQGDIPPEELLRSAHEEQRQGPRMGEIS